MAPHDLARERAPLPLPDVCSRAAPRHEPNGRPAREVLAGGSALGADWFGRSSFDSGARRPGPRRVLGEGQRLLINDPARFKDMRVIGVDEHAWRRTP